MSNSLQQSLSRLSQQHANLSMRERLVILLAGVGLTLFVGGLLWVEPAWQQLERDRLQNIAMQKRFASLDQQITQLQAQLQQDPNAHLQKKITLLMAEETRLDQQLAAQTSDLVPAKQMTKVLENLLTKSENLKLMVLESLPATVIQAKSEAASASNPSLGLFQHGVRLQVEGDFFSIQRYLQMIEQSPWQFYWKRFDYQVVDYPTAQLELEVYTLSTSEAFIGV